MTTATTRTATPGPPTSPTSPARVMPPIDILKWVEEHRHELKPPVSNKYLYDGKDFFVMVIAGPNARNDFHVTNSEEYFYQLKGDIVVRIREDDRIKDVVVREGETFFIPGNVPHSPTRPPDTIGVVVERVRPAGETEHLQFYCEKCEALVHDLEFDCADIVDHFSRAMKEFWADERLSTCRACGTRVVKAKPVKSITFDADRGNVKIEREG
jgi:3-hydroxyanthranilate 3,4-dioxygenase